MCGILAYLGGTALPIDHPAIQSVAHRGPDDQGAEDFPVGDRTLTLGHRRLSILDLSPAGRQPMSYGNARYWIVYNGEVYNYLELRRELEATGHRFQSRTDTEVVLAAYAQWGEACLDRFNGMFAFVLFDARDQKLFLARDRFGIKPLYIWNSPRGLAVASEIKQFLSLPGFEAGLNAQTAYEFLVFDDWDHGPETFLTGVEHLPPGHLVRLDLNRWRPGQALSRRPWYVPGGPGEKAVPQGEPAVERFGELLRDAVRLRLRADVPVGFCLSGGLDSSALVMTADRLLADGGGDLNTFSARFNDARFDEGEFIEAVRGAARVRGHDAYPEPEAMLDDLDKVIWHQDQPLSTSSVYAQWRVFETARQSGVPVTLDGQGADEVLAGYHSYFGPRLWTLVRRLRPAALAREVRGISSRHGYGTGTILKMIALCLAPIHWRLQLLWPDEVRRNHQALDPDWLAGGRVRRRGPHPMRRRRSVRRMTISRLTRTLPALLHNADRMSMAHSVEARVPFLDSRLVEFSLAAADDDKILAGETKRLLRLATRNLLPDKVRTRTDKLTFQPPEGEWIRTRLADDFADRLDRALDLPLFNGPVVKARFEDFLSGGQPYDRLFWRIVTFGRWRERFRVRLN